MELKKWLGENNQIGIDIWHKKYQHMDESFDEWLERVSGGDPELKQLISSRKFLFAGRVLANRSIDGSGNFYNCFSDGYVPDSMSGIMDTAKTLALTYKIQGGQGISLSKIRPKGTKVGDEYESDGIIPFMRIFNSVTSGVSQGGSRKGALMISLDIRHKDAKEFITIKTNENEMDKANLSLEIDDDFMKAVEKFYETGEEVKIHERRSYSGHTIEYDIVPIKLYKLMMKTVYDWGEPGCIFTNQFKNYNLMEKIDEYEIASCNPCGEQPLKEKTSCNLGSLNLYEFVSDPFTKNAKFNYEELTRAIKIAINALDQIIEENYNRQPLAEYRQNSIDYRNIGLGVFGYADMLMALGLRYGSVDAINFSEGLFHVLFTQSVIISSDLAEEKGSFPKYSPEVYDSEIIKEHFGEAEREVLKSRGLRNCSLLSIAPTGSIAPMLGRSGGAEPQFALSYNRRTENLNDTYKIDASIVQDYRAISGNNGELPDYFAVSADINWRDRVKTQSAMQKHIDTAISSTVNLPQDTSPEEIEYLYLYAWQKKLKGITIFRSGCKRPGILTTEDKTSETEKAQFDGETLQRGDIVDVSDDLLSAKRTITSGCGKFYLHSDFDEFDGAQYETFIDVGSGGGCERNLQFISRLISYVLRIGGTIEGVIDQALSVKPCTSYITRTLKKGDTSKGTSCPSAIGYALQDLNEKIWDRCFADESQSDTSGQSINENINSNHESLSSDHDYACPECGEALTFEGGCNICKSCGYSKCD